MSEKPEPRRRPVTLELDEETIAYLQVLTDEVAHPALKDVLEHLAHSAADGVMRPGAWERAWVQQCFGDEWESKLERHPTVTFFTAPKAT